MELTFENRGKFDVQVFFWLMECYLSPILLFGPVAIFTGAIKGSEYSVIITDWLFAFLAIVCFVVLPIFMYRQLRKKS